MKTSNKVHIVRKAVKKTDLLEHLRKLEEDKKFKEMNPTNEEINIFNEELDDGESEKVFKKTDIGTKKVINLIKPKVNQENVNNEENKVNSTERFIAKKKEITIVGKTYEKVLKVTTVTKLQVASKTINTINHEDIEYKNKNYTVCCCPYLDTHILYVIDSDDKDKIINRAMHFRTDGGYIASAQIGDDGNRKELYLHNIIMNKLTFEGKGQQQTVDHINRIGRDNRKCNLRMAESQSAQNFNQKRRERTTELPEESGLTADDMPKNVYYAKQNGPHGEHFYIEIRGVKDLGEKFVWKSTKSNKVSLKIKLQETIDKMMELRDQYPILKEIFVTEDTEELRHQLITEYNEIIQLSHYPADIILNNIFTFEGELYNKQEIQKDDEIIILETTKKLREYGRKADQLPPNCGVTIDQIPKYCYYKPASDKRGDKFIIERHPKILEQGKRQWATSESKSLTTLDKFNLMIIKLNEFNEI